MINDAYLDTYGSDYTSNGKQYRCFKIVAFTEYQIEDGTLQGPWGEDYWAVREGDDGDIKEVKDKNFVDKYSELSATGDVLLMTDSDGVVRSVTIDAQTNKFLIT